MPSNCGNIRGFFLPLKSTSMSLFSLTSSKNLIVEIKNINNQLFNYEKVIAEKENVESVVGVHWTEQSEGSLVKIIYNAVTINQNLVSHFTYDKKVDGFTFYFQLFAFDYFDFHLIDYGYWFSNHWSNRCGCLFLLVISLPLLLFWMNCHWKSR